MLVALVAVQSIDGFITFHRGSGTAAWASAEDGAHFRAAMDTYDCSVFGSTTYDVDRASIQATLGSHRLRVVVTRRPEDYEGDGVPDQLEFSDATPATIVAGLASRGFERCALLGGGRINTLFLQDDVVDELVITLEPRIFGSGTRLVDGSTDLLWELVDDSALNRSTRLLHYRRSR